jgi:hypothetical protein
MLFLLAQLWSYESLTPAAAECAGLEAPFPMIADATAL